MDILRDIYVHFLDIFNGYPVQDVDIYNGYLGSIWDIDIPSIIPQQLAPDPSHGRAKSLPSESRCSVTSVRPAGPPCTGMGPAGAGPGAQGWAPPAPAQERRDGPRWRRPRSAGRPPLGQPCALAQCLHRPQPLPTGREGHHFRVPCICTSRHNRFRTSRHNRFRFSGSEQPVGNVIANQADIHTSLQYRLPSFPS